MCAAVSLRTEFLIISLTMYFVVSLFRRNIFPLKLQPSIFCHSSTPECKMFTFSPFIILQIPTPSSPLFLFSMQTRGGSVILCFLPYGASFPRSIYFASNFRPLWSQVETGQFISVWMSEVLKPFVWRVLSHLWNMLPVSRLCRCINEAYSSPAFVWIDRSSPLR